MDESSQINEALILEKMLNVAEITSLKQTQIKEKSNKTKPPTNTLAKLSFTH